MSVDNDEDSFQGTPPEIQMVARNAAAHLLPVKSKELYEKMYDEYLEWKIKNNVRRTTENVMLAFFKELSEKFCPTTLWTKYSFLHATIRLRERVDIEKFASLQAFIKQKNVGYQANKAKPLTEWEIQTFLRSAPQEYYLTKVVFIFALLGCLRCCELVNLKIDDITEIPGKNMFLVEVLDTKNHEDRSFTIKDEYYGIIKQYLSLRPKNVKTDRLFLNYQLNTCTKQAVGKNKIAKMPRQIAEFLKLPLLEKYTGHSFRRSSATVASNGGADVITLKQLGGWKSDKVAQSYVEKSLFAKEKIANIISKQIGPSGDSNQDIGKDRNVENRAISQNEEPPRKKFRFVPKKPMFSQPILTQPTKNIVEDHLVIENVNIENVNNEIDISEFNLDNFITESVINETDLIVNNPVSNDIVINNSVPNLSKILPNNFVFNNCAVTFQINSTN